MVIQFSGKLNAPIEKQPSFFLDKTFGGNRSPSGHEIGCLKILAEIRVQNCLFCLGPQIFGNAPKIEHFYPDDS